MGRATSGGSCGEKREWEDAGGAVDMAGTGNGPGPATDVDTGPGPAVEAGPGLVLGTGTGSGPATDADTGPEADPGPVAGTSTGSCPATEADTGLETDPSSGPDTDAVPDPLPGAGTVPGLFPDPVADPDVESQPRGGFRCRLCQVSAANRECGGEVVSSGGHRSCRGGGRAAVYRLPALPFPPVQGRAWRSTSGGRSTSGCGLCGPNAGPRNNGASSLPVSPAAPRARNSPTISVPTAMSRRS